MFFSPKSEPSFATEIFDPIVIALYAPPEDTELLRTILA